MHEAHRLVDRYLEARGRFCNGSSFGQHAVFQVTSSYAHLLNALRRTRTTHGADASNGSCCPKRLHQNKAFQSGARTRGACIVLCMGPRSPQKSRVTVVGCLRHREGRDGPCTRSVRAKFTKHGLTCRPRVEGRIWWHALASGHRKQLAGGATIQYHQRLCVRSKSIKMVSGTTCVHVCIYFL